jgi:hypothetical protein
MLEKKKELDLGLSFSLLNKANDDPAPVRKPLTVAQAYELDRDGFVYVDLDEDSGYHGVFGSQSAFCYALFADVTEANKLAEHQNAVMRRHT